MATSGIRSDDEDNNVENVKEWPLAYVRESKEYMCGRCGQALVSTHTAEDLETHFRSCENNDENGLLSTKLDKFETEVTEKMKKEILNLKTEFDKVISDFGKDLETKTRETRDEALSYTFSKAKALEEGMKEKMAEVNGRVSGVTETISTVVRSVLEAKGTSSTDDQLSAELTRMKNESKAVWERLDRREKEVQSLRTRLDNGLAEAKTEAEAFVEQLKTNARGLRDLKRHLEDQASKLLANKKLKSFHQEPTPSDQVAIPMNCYNLIAHNYLFQPSFRWTIDGINAFLPLNTFELTSEMFQWNGYPVRARAKLQLKEKDRIYLSLCLDAENQLSDFLPLSGMYYLLKDQRFKSSDHKCLGSRYLFSTKTNCPFMFESFLCPKSWFGLSKYNANNSIEIEIYVEPSPMTQLAQSYDGTIEWTIENYKRKSQLEKDKLNYYQESPYFYTGPSGYRVQVVLYLNGRGEKGPTAYVMFLTGKYDAHLPKSFSHSTTVTLVNRKDPEKSISKTIVKDIEKERQYEIEVCKFKEVQDLVENDTLFCKMVVKSQ